ncbi:MAG: MFS transporter [Marinilabiliales bacterium]|nr:MFS transporter [Marinilabiliales bacterium]
MPLIGREFGLDAVNLGWVLTAYTLAAAMFLVPFGRLADLVGRKRIFTLGIAVNIAGTACSAPWPRRLSSSSSAAASRASGGP